MNLIYLAEDALHKGKPLKALNYFLKAYEETQDEDLLIDIALLYQELGNTTKAYETFETILEKNPEECIAYYGIATLLDEEEKYAEATSYYEKAVEINPFYDRAYFFLAGAYDALEEKSKAITCYERVLELIPDDFWTLTNLGAIYEEQCDVTTAYRLFKKAYEVDNTHSIASFNLAVVLGKLGKLQEAVYYYEKSLKADHTYPYAYLNLGVLYKEHNDIPKGIEVLTEGITYAPESFLYYNRACFYALLNHKEEALSDLKVAYVMSEGFIAYSKQDEDLINILPLLDN